MTSRLFDPQLPDNPDGSPMSVSNLYLRVDSILERGNLIIQQAMLPMERSDSATISLDFDLRFPTPQGCTDEFVWDTLESARNKKNSLFVACLTPKFLETFR